MGIAIGFPQGFLIREVFMSRVKEKLFQSGHPLLEHVFLWYSYVDDIFSVWTGPINSIYNFLNFIKSVYSLIHFTVEVGGSKINFLDLTNTTEPDGFDFKVCRKCTTTNIFSVIGSHFCP